MPTLQEWQQALDTPRAILIDSTQQLADQINMLGGTSKFTSEGGIPKTAVGASEFDPPQNIQVAPVEILSSLGRITTPKIDNLADISSTWARIRYLWAFEPTPANTTMQLSRIAKEIDFHQKGLLSDEMGVGFASYIISNYFGGSNPADLDVIFREGSVSDLELIYSTKPDYIFEHPTEGYILVECKGTQSGDSASKKQLRRGLEQVPSVEVAGKTLRSYVVGTSLSPDGVKVFIVDPPGDKNVSKHDNRKSYKIEKQQLDEAFQTAQAASLYKFIGRFDKARELTKTKKEFMQREDVSTIRNRIDEIDEQCIGQTQEIRYAVDGLSIKVFQGMPESLFDALETKDFKTLNETATSIHAKAEKVSKEIKSNKPTEVESKGAYWTEITHNAIQATVVDKDGTVTQFEIQ